MLEFRSAARVRKNAGNSKKMLGESNLRDGGIPRKAPISDSAAATPSIVSRDSGNSTEGSVHSVDSGATHILQQSMFFNAKDPLNIGFEPNDYEVDDLITLSIKEDAQKEGQDNQKDVKEALKGEKGEEEEEESKRKRKQRRDRRMFIDEEIKGYEEEEDDEEEEEVEKGMRTMRQTSDYRRKMSVQVTKELIRCNM